MTPFTRDDPQLELGAAGHCIEPSNTSIIPASAPTPETAGGAG
jgi:hypothetical protein